MPQPLDPTRAPSLPPPEFGLALGYVICSQFLGMEDLHYGYWPAGLAVELRNLPQAQATYTDFLLSHVPQGVRTVLDVGCGAGNTAVKLLARGYQVDCVSPNPYLTGVTRQKLGDRGTVFEGRFEDLDTERRYDLLVFSESFLFIKPDRALPLAERVLNPGGHILMTDIFKVPTEGKSPIGGGHHLPVFREKMAASNFEQVEEVDMTARIAPTFDVLDRAYRDGIRPVYDLVAARLQATRPWTMRVVRWAFGKKLTRLEDKHFSGRRNGTNFAKYGSYRLFLFRRRPAR